MGQYHLTVNLDKKQYLNPHQLGNGLKLLEQLGSNVPSALFMLLTVSNGRGGGDFNDDESNELIGSWGGDRIVVIGDYAEPTDLPPEFKAETLYGRCNEHTPDCEIPASEHFRNISGDLRPLLEKYLGIRFVSREGWMHFVETCYDHPDKARGHRDHVSRQGDPFAPEYQPLSDTALDRELRLGTPPKMLGITTAEAKRRNNGWSKR